MTPEDYALKIAESFAETHDLEQDSETLAFLICLAQPHVEAAQAEARREALEAVTLRLRRMLRLRRIIYSSTSHESHACPDNDCAESWSPEDILVRLSRFVEEMARQGEGE